MIKNETICLNPFVVCTSLDHNKYITRNIHRMIQSVDLCSTCKSVHWSSFHSTVPDDNEPQSGDSISPFQFRHLILQPLIFIFSKSTIWSSTIVCTWPDWYASVSCVEHPRKSCHVTPWTLLVSWYCQHTGIMSSASLLFDFFVLGLVMARLWRMTRVSTATAALTGCWSSCTNPFSKYGRLAPTNT